jgi:hypothetical protein
MSKIEQMEAELRKLSQPELRQIREWLDDIIDPACISGEIVDRRSPDGRATT